MKKVIYLRSNPIDPDPRVEKEVRALSKAGFNVTILAWDRDADKGNKGQLTSEKEKIPIYYFSLKSNFGGGIKNILKLARFQFYLVKKLLSLRNRYEIIHAADFDTVIPAYLMKVLYKKKLVYDIFDFYVDAFSVPKMLIKPIKKIDLGIISRADAVILATENRLKQIKGSNPKSIEYIHNTPEVTTELTLSTLPKNRESITLGYVGVLQPGRLLEEILNVASRNPKIKITLAGFGPLEESIKEKSLKYENITFLGKVDYSESLKINSESDIMFATYDPTIPNHVYSSPNKLYEAMLLSKPLIVCNGTGIDELINTEKIGFTIDYSEKSFENLLETILQDHHDLECMAKKSYALYQQRFSWSVMENRLIEMYKRL